MRRRCSVKKAQGRYGYRLSGSYRCHQRFDCRRPFECVCPIPSCVHLMSSYGWPYNLDPRNFADKVVMSRPLPRGSSQNYSSYFNRCFPLLSPDTLCAVRWCRVRLLGDLLQRHTPIFLLPLGVGGVAHSEHFPIYKILVFKKRRRKGSKTTKGHRRDISMLRVTDIIS